MPNMTSSITILPPANSPEGGAPRRQAGCSRRMTRSACQRGQRDSGRNKVQDHEDASEKCGDAGAYAQRRGRDSDSLSLQN